MITIIIPTYNEKDNLPIVVDAIFSVFNDNLLQGDIVIVDDNSPDGTGEIADELSIKNNKIKVLHRRRKEGLSSAIIQGFKYTGSNIIGVMDADLSHPPEMIPELIRPLLDGESEFVIASRYIRKEKIEKWPLSRKMISRGATILARPLTDVSDPMSGFFFLKRTVIDGIELSPIGYKIMLEIIVKGRYINIKEIPFTFKNRYKGESKLNWKEHLNYVQHLIKLYRYSVISSHQ
ncbi:glycosyl transferase [Candidatus Methanoperedens nitroreducens]|uniref:Dolichol-phosphate mannosyltransferase n=1 Tax=Candidatus Methanoperedens nitratireducens TaxID=1392998 RepID=A0A062UUT7_9EURY|nr:polyprenol monophosphomannose synthase [Candidatus Methanoperedens nitroreducens]KCZ70791.1 glycosyl transferase [Candidatus Methanoperedens nitroreducens]MDJ1420646.1 polyprenol monophosphomannose synthase [Candidatus Methanoperedens sp.]